MDHAYKTALAFAHGADHTSHRAEFPNQTFEFLFYIQIVIDYSHLFAEINSMIVMRKLLNVI